MTDYYLDLIDCIKEASYTPNFNTRVSRTNTGLVDITALPGGFFDFDITIREGDRDFIEKYGSFFHKMKGSETRFYVKIQKLSFSKGDYRGNILVNGASQTGNAIAVTGMNTNICALRAGDFITFSSKEKAYQITEDLISTGGGTGTMKISPDIYLSPNDSDNVIFNDIYFRVVLSPESDINLNYNVYMRSGLQFQLWEAFIS